MVTVNKHVADASQEAERVPDGLTAKDLVLGKRVVRIVFILCLVAFVALVVIAVYMYQSVPLDTRMPYDGRGGRSGRGIPMPIAVMICFIFPFVWWRALRKPNAHQIGKGTRVTVCIGASVMLPGAILGQLVIAQALLVEAGVLPG